MEAENITRSAEQSKWPIVNVRRGQKYNRGNACT